MASKNINIGFDEELLKKIDHKAKEEGRSRSNYIRFMISEYLEFEGKETQYKNKIAELEKELIEKNVMLKSIPKQPDAQNNKENKSKFSNPLIDDLMGKFNS